MRSFLRDVRSIYRFVTDPERARTYHPEVPLKSRARVLSDLVLWRARHKEVNTYYFCWGMDRVGGPRAADLMPYRRFRALRDGRNSRGEGGFDYRAVTRDKYLFYLTLSALGYPTPSVLALLDPEGVTWLHPRREPAPLATLAEADEEVEVFCKPRFGVQGRGVFRLRAGQGRVAVNGEAATVEALAARVARLKGGVVQAPLVQHPALAALHPPSVNTLRVITVRAGGRARVFSRPMLRVGTGGSIVDNGMAGNLQVFTDPEAGRLVGPGIRLRGGGLDRQPDTGLVLDGYAVPFYAEALALAVRLHGELPGLHSVGWDLVITEGGPVVLEGNDNWAAGLRLGLEPGFSEAFLRACAEP